MRSSSPSCSGQAAVDYVALVTLVCVLATGVATAAAAAGGPSLTRPVAAAIRHGICTVSGAWCTAAQARAAGLAPCSVDVRAGAERVGGNVAVVRVGRDDAVIVERRSDGTVAVSFADGWRAGGTIGAGLQSGRVRGHVEGAAGFSFTAGRTYELPDGAAARRFLARYAEDETVGGEARRTLRGIARAVCARCARALGAREERPLPAPSARYEEGGAWTEVAGMLEIPVVGGVAASVGRSGVMGRRIAGDRRTLYLRLRDSGVAHAGVLFASLQATRGAELLLELTSERGRPVQARFRAAVEGAWEADALGASVDLADVARAARGAAARHRAGDLGGTRLDAAVTLDLRDEANRRALHGVLSPGASPLEWDDRIAALARRLDVAGAVDLTVSTTTATETSHDVEVPGVGAGYERTERTRHLVEAWSRPGGGGLRRREDCEAAAGAAAAAAPV